MKATRIYQPGSYQPGEVIQLSEQAGHHVGVVLRMQAGEQLIIFPGDNREFVATIESVKKKQVQVRIDSVSEVDRESFLKLHLAQAISKGERMELVMQKAAELGVATITPIISMHCSVKMGKERLDKKLQQWQSIVISACEQSGRNRVPTVQDPVHLYDFVRMQAQGLKLVLDPQASKTWRDYPVQQENITLLIGPEGGLSEAEIVLAQDNAYEALSLGARVLRTETAAIAAVSVLQAVAGDL